MFRSAGAALLLLVSGCAEGTGPTVGEIVSVIGGATGTTTGSGSLTTLEVDRGLREALTIGTNRVATELGRTNGFWNNPQIRIPLPGRLAELQDSLSGVGLSGPLDDLQLRLNRAAEAAVPAGRDLIIDAVRSITLDDAIGLLRGGDTAATEFLRGKTEAKIASAFRPYLETQLSQVGAFDALDRATAQYGLSGLGSSLKTSLIDHGVQYGLDGLFNYLAEEEKAIRNDPLKRTTELLRRVFGSAQ